MWLHLVSLTARASGGMLIMRSLTTRPTRGAAQVWSAAGVRGQAIDWSRDARGASQRACFILDLTASSLHLRAMYCSTCAGHVSCHQHAAIASAASAHLLHTRLLPVQVQGQHADHAQGVHVSVRLDHGAH